MENLLALLLILIGSGLKHRLVGIVAERVIDCAEAANRSNS